MLVRIVHAASGPGRSVYACSACAPRIPPCPDDLEVLAAAEGGTVTARGLGRWLEEERWLGWLVHAQGCARCHCVDGRACPRGRALYASWRAARNAVGADGDSS
ncbi:hypothetical protein [Streptomyces gobiensis]|uniref:hypothetical protein n=1 Tax=Streptomyces gobiensis TaxID=2875706 RepID=UPI001E5AE112|nr:hypothetical protein [Streptomyces gobiensis]UGY95323.1 hypothetical protein test1122_11300 [Streptomyces gobiensis]